MVEKLHKTLCHSIHADLELVLEKNEWFASPCCYANYKPKIDPLKENWFEELFTDLRQSNLNGSLDQKICTRCIDEESLGKQSMRQGELVKRGNSLPTPVKGPRKIQFKLSRTCNNACLICGPVDSSLWYRYAEDSSRYKTRTFPTEKKIDDILQNLDLSELTNLQFRGGEPFIDQWHLVTLEKMLSQKNVDPSKIDLQYWTNGTRASAEVYSIWKKFKNVFVYFSVDDIEQAFEYQRWPAEWKELEANVRYCFENSSENVTQRFERTINILNLHRLGEFNKWHVKNFSSNKYNRHCKVNTHFATRTVLDTHNLSDAHKQWLTNVDDKYSRIYINHVLKSHTQKLDSNKKILYWVQSQERKRNNSVDSFFPEFKSLYQ